MQTNRQYFRVPALMFWTVILAAFTAVLSGAPLKTIRAAAGQGVFWLIGLALVTLAVGVHMYALAFVIGAQVILIGAYCEFEEHGLLIRHAAFLSILISTLASTAMFYMWAALAKQNWFDVLSGWIGEFLNSPAAKKISIFSGLKPDVLVYQLPSALVIFLVLSLALALILERPISRWAGLELHRREKLTTYANPDFLIWILIFSVLGTFLHEATKPVQVLSLNVLNVSILAYFFQGLGVLVTYFEAFQVGFFWRLMWVLILVIQLPVVLSVVGVVDYWMEFRQFLIRKAAQLRKKRVQE